MQHVKITSGDVNPVSAYGTIITVMALHTVDMEVMNQPYALSELVARKIQTEII